MLDALESILHLLEALESPSRSPHSPLSSPSGPFLIRGCSEKCIPLELAHTRLGCDRIFIYADAA
jgi:hypothetical protein